MIATRIDAEDVDLVRRIDEAFESVTLYAPGVSMEVALSLVKAIQRLNGRVKIVLDFSARSVELGYLQIDPLQMLWDAQEEIDMTCLYMAGEIRLATLQTDNDLLIYASRPPNADEPEHLGNECPNGIEFREFNGAIDVTRGIKEEPLEFYTFELICNEIDSIDDRPFEDRLEEERETAENALAESNDIRKENVRLMEMINKAKAVLTDVCNS